MEHAMQTRQTNANRKPKTLPSRDANRDCVDHEQPSHVGRNIYQYRAGAVWLVVRNQAKLSSLQKLNQRYSKYTVE